MQVEMADVEAHIARTHQTHDRVQIGAVVIKQTAGGVHQLLHLHNLFFKKPEGVGIGRA